MLRGESKVGVLDALGHTGGEATCVSLTGYNDLQSKRENA